MDLRNKTTEELIERRAALAAELEKPEADLDAIDTEVRAINEELENRKKAEEKRAALRNAVAAGSGTTTRSFQPSDRKPKTDEEVRSSKAYINAFANYIKNNDDSECRALLLSENASGQVPVPTYLEERIRTNWDKLPLMSLLRKTYIRGNIKVGFELSATAAVVHTEGSSAPSDETLTFGVVSMVPESIKKWIKISDEAMDLGGEEFLNYVYDELTYQIAKKAQSELIGKITALTASATSTAVGVGVVTGTPSVGVVAEAIGNLSEDAQNPVCVMNRLTWAQFKAAQYAGNFDVDPFEGFDVHFDATLPAYSTAGTTGSAWMIVGDFAAGAQANFPNGQEIRIVIDDKSLAESDLVKFVGREYVAIGIVGDKCFTKVVF